MRKVLFTLSALTTLAAASLSADSCDPCNSCDPCDMNFCDFDFCGELTFYGDWLYWKARRCDLNFALTQNSVSTTTTPAASELLGLEPKYESGFRVGVYYAMDEGATAGVRYTHFESDFSKLHTNSTSFLVNRSHPSLYTSANYANASYKVDYDVVDIEFGPSLEISDDVKVRPFVSTRLAWIDEKMTTTYADNATLASATTQTTIYERNDIKAAGAGFGFELHRGLFCGLGAYVRTTFSIMYADYDMYYRQTYTASETDYTPINAKQKGECLLPVIEIATGLNYEMCEICGFTPFFTAGYEFTSWIGAKDFINFVDDVQDASISRNKTNLGFEGLFVRVGATF